MYKNYANSLPRRGRLLACVLTQAISNFLNYKSYTNFIPLMFAVFRIPGNAVPSENGQAQPKQSHIQHGVEVSDDQRKRSTEHCEPNIPRNAYRCLQKEGDAHCDHDQASQLTFLLCAPEQQPKRQYSKNKNHEKERCPPKLMDHRGQKGILKLHAFIDETEYLSDLQKKFYKTYSSARYELILKPAFDKIQTLRK